MVLLKLLSLFVCFCAVEIVEGSDRRPPLYNNEFAVHVPDGEMSANEIASKHGFVNRGQVSDVSHYL